MAITTNGKVEPRSTSSARAEFGTFVRKIEISEGEIVHRGQPLLRLSVDLGYELAQARADLATAQADLSYLGTGGLPDTAVQLNEDLKKAQANVRNFQRINRSLTELVAKQAASQDELAQNRTALAQAKATLESLNEKQKNFELRHVMDKEHASYRLRQAQERMKQIDDMVRAANVVSPEDGTVFYLPVRAGDYVKAGDLLAEIADLRQMQVRAFVDEPDLGNIALNERVRVRWDARPGNLWTGHIEQLPTHVVTHGVRNVGEITCSVDNDNLQLLPDVNVDVEVLVKEVRQVLVVPRETVVHDNRNHFVFVYDNGRIHRRTVTLGIVGTNDFEVLSGLTDEDQVIVPYDFQPRDGMVVQATETR